MKRSSLRTWPVVGLAVSWRPSSAMFTLMLSAKTIILLLAAIGAAIGAWQAAQIRRRMDEPTAANRCIACDSPTLQITGRDAYRCMTCGYEGGVGQRALAEQKAAAKYASMDAQERQARALRALQNALHTLMGAPARPEGGNERDDIAHWISSVESCALAGARELEEALRAGGGAVAIPGRGAAFDPTPLLERLRQACGGQEIILEGGNAQGARRVLGVIDQVRGVLQVALQGVPSSPDRSASVGPYQS